MRIDSLLAKISKNYYILFPLLLIVLFSFSTRLIIYNYLKNYFSLHNSYLLDQGLFLLILLIAVSVFVITKRTSVFTYKNLLRFSLVIILFGLYFVFLLNFQSELLNRYFVKDDQFVLLPALLREEALDYRYSNKLDFYYYHFGAAVMLFKFFKLDAYFYNVFTLGTLALSAVVLLKVLNYFNTIHNFGNGLLKLLVIITTLLYVVSPSIMDSFVYMEHAVATGYIAAGILLSIYFYILFLKDKKRTIFFLLSFILMLFLLKTSLTRAGFLPACLILLELLSVKKIYEVKSAIARSILIFIPFSIIAFPYILPDTESSGRLYGIGIDRFLNTNRLYLFFSNIVLTLIPFQFAAPVFKSVRTLYLEDFNAPTENFFLNHMFFSSGVILFIIISTIILIFYFKKINAKYALYFWLCSIISLLFYMLFGNVGESHPAHLFDHSNIIYGTTPGSRYYPLPLIFLIVTIYIIFASAISRFKLKTKKLILILSSIILTFTVWSNINFTQKVNHSANEGIVTVKIITEKVLTMVPDNNEKKVIYSTSGRINDIEYIIRGFHGFFRYSAPEYFWQEEELIKYLKENGISKNNLFGFSFDRKTLLVEDKSNEVKKQFKNYLF